MSGELAQNEPDKKKRLIRNIFFSSLSWFLPLILGFVATPVLVEGLGYEDYGLFSLILGFISYSFTFGIGRAVTKYVAEYRVQGKAAQINEIISATFWLTLALGALGALAINLGSQTIVQDVLQIKPENYETSVKALYYASAIIGFLMIGQVFQAIVQALHRFDRHSLLLNLNGFLLTAGNIALVYSGFKLNALLAWNLSITILNCLLFYRSAKRFLPEFRINFRFGGETSKLVMRYGLSVIGYQIFGNILLLFERGWITRKLGAEILTFYVVPMTLALYYHGFIASIIMVFFPVFSELQGNRENLVGLYQKATKFVFASTIFVILTVFCGGRLFLELWLGADLAGKTYEILIVHFFSFGIIAVMTVVWQLAEGFGRPRINMAITLVWLITAIPLMIVSVEQLNIVGIGFARLAGILLTIPFVFFVEKKILGEIQTNFWLKNIFIIGAAGILAAAAERYLFSYAAGGWLVFLFGSITGALVYGLVLWLLNFISKEEKILLRGYLRI